MSIANLLDQLPLLASAPQGVKRLRELILELAVRGKLVPQDPNDEPASELLKRIQAEKARLVAEGKIKQGKPLPEIGEDEKPFEVPVGWEWRRLDDLLQISGGVTLGRKLQGRKLVSVPYLRVANVQRGYLVLDVIKSVEVPIEEVAKYQLLQDDLLITEGGDWDKVGRTAIWKSEIPKCLHQNHVFRARRLAADWDVHWTEMYLNSFTAREYFAGSSKQTTNLASINMTQLRGCVFPLPPLPEQHRIVAKVDELMALCDRLEAQQADAASAHTTLVKTLLDTLTTPDQPHGAARVPRPDRFSKPVRSESTRFAADWQRIAQHFDTLFTTEASIAALKQTLLQLAVMGKLVPQDPNDEPASELLKRIQVEKARLVAEGKIKQGKPLPAIGEDEKPFELPVGWEWVRLPVVYFSISPSGSKLLSSAIFESGAVPVVDQGKRFIAGFTDEASLLINLPGPVVVFGDHTTERKYIDFDFVAGADGVKILRPVLQNERFFFRQLQGYRLEERGYARHFKVLNDNLYALPPLPEQSRIVAKVDELMALCDQLAARLKAARELAATYATAATEAALVAA